MIISLAAYKSWKIFQLDVKFAFLQGDLSEEVYVAQPPGYIQEGEDQLVYKLHKALYGPKQAPRGWFSNEGIFICQRKYTEEVLSRFGMTDCNSVTCPIVPGTKLNKDPDGELVDETYFKQMVGSLIYLTTTRPDLVYTVSLLS
ncbi:hypothetical protein LIER_03306 [Lithospermum erythrorhizon]|uniref:Reverse transcriptase Ty1/copia-type domain-containing protein n=1 Tax=Lithospermum erythrorhizon TaxID=34254 RepID=A0AAV3NXC2_LITER